MPQSVFSHPALVSIPAAIAVILVTGMFLRHLVTLGNQWTGERESAQQEREAFLLRMDRLETQWSSERKQSQDALQSLIRLAQTMVDRCQGGILPEHRLTTDDVGAASKPKKG